jgi:TolA-binding protein
MFMRIKRIQPDTVVQLWAGRCRARAWLATVLLASGGGLAIVPVAYGAPPQRQAAFNPAGEDLVLQPIAPGQALKRKTSGLFSGRTSEPSPARQWELARRLNRQGESRAAAKACDALVRRWPYAPEAAAAQQRLAELHAERGRLKRAFEDYRYLIHFYPDHVALATILERMTVLARQTLERGSEARARDMFLLIADYAPQWSGTAAVLLSAGDLQRRDGDWFEALATFERVTARFPGSDEAQRAAAEAAHVLHHLSRRFSEDDSIHVRALAALNATLRDYPAHADREALARELAELTARRYERHFGMAGFYDNRRFKPETVVAAYRDFIRRFPDAPQVEQARRRIGELTSGGTGLPAAPTGSGE